MKKMIFAAMVAMLSFGAFAEDKVVELDGKAITVTDMDTTGSSKFRVGAEFCEKGIYVKVTDGGAPWGDRMLNAEKIVKDRLIKGGCKLLDEPDSNSIAIAFFSNGNLNMAKADQAAEQGINATKTVATLGVAASVISVVGKAGSVGYLFGGMFEDEELYFSASIYEGPYMAEWRNKPVLRYKKETESGISIEYELPDDKAKHPTQDILLKIALEDWLNHYMIWPVAKAPTALTLPASAASPTNE